MNMNNRIQRAVLSMILFFLYGCTGLAPGISEREGKPRIQPITIRVAVEKNRQRFDVASRNGLLMTGGEQVKLPASATLLTKEGYLTFNGRHYALPVSVTGSHTIQMNGKQYIGELIVHEGLVVNVLPLEEYLKGVLSQEMSEAWPIEALKAQAVISRTYAFKKMLENRSSLYDIERTEVHQKFEYEDHNERINTAIANTRGIILVYQGQPIEAFFHSCSGGRTENCRDVFQRDLPYLRSIPDPYCLKNERSFWSYSVESERMKELLHEMLDEDHRSLSLYDVRMYGKTGSGRVKEFKLVFGNGRSQIIRGNAFRLALDPKAFKSLLIHSIERERTAGGWKFRFSGRGYGHGVGLSQWGAKGMAEQGFTYREILSFYYRRTSLGTYRSLSLKEY